MQHFQKPQIYCSRQHFVHSFHPVWNSSHNVNEVWKQLLNSLRFQNLRVLAYPILCYIKNNKWRSFYRNNIFSILPLFSLRRRTILLVFINFEVAHSIALKISKSMFSILLGETNRIDKDWKAFCWRSWI